MRRRRTMNKNIAFIIAGAIIIGQLPISPLANRINNLNDDVIEVQEKNAETGAYIQDYDDDSGLIWTRFDGDGLINKSKDEGVLNIKRTDGNLVFIEEQTPSLYDGEAEMRFMLNPSEDDDLTGRFGLVFRGSSNAKHAFIGYNANGNWVIQGGDTWKDDIKGPKVEAGEWVVMKVRFVGDKITLMVNGETIFDDTVDLGGMPTISGKFGYRTWYDNKDVKVDYLKCGSVGSLGDTELPEMVIESVDSVQAETYPRIRPELPEKIGVIFQDGSRSTRNVYWDYIPKESYANPGEFTVNGTVEGTDVKAEARIIVRGIAEEYNTDFESEATKGDWQVLRSTGTPEIVDFNGGKAVKVPMNGVSLAADMASPSVKNFTYETEFSVDSDTGRIGLAFRISDADNWGSVCYDAGAWIWQTMNDGVQSYGSFPASFKLEKNKIYKMKIKVEDSNAALWIDDQLIGKSAIANLPIKAGKVGLTGWFANKNVTLDNVKVNEITPPAPPVVEERTEVIESEKMKVTLDGNFPRVISYEWKEDGAVLNGEDEQLYLMEVNGDKYIPKVTSQVKENVVTYNLQVEELGITVTLDMIIEDNKLRMEVTNIEEGETKLQYLNFPGHSLASVTSREGGETASVLTTGDWNNIQEEFASVRDLPAATKGKTYAFINNDSFAVTVNNNTIEGGNRVVLITENKGDIDGTYKKTGISNGTWTYKEVLEDKTSLGSKLYQGELPWSEVIIARDENKDGQVDWQDGAMKYRENMKIPVGGEDIRNQLSRIDLNIGLTQNPFLRSLDQVKKISNYTDNFGQLVLNKGYQAEGHDDSHPDYGGHIGMRQGGVEDFNTLINEGAKYNAKIGVHINATEYMKDAFQYPNGLVNEDSKGWGWLDQAYYVDQKADVMTGELFRRLDMLKADAPNLGWVYVDVYTGNGWNSHQLGEKINELGYMVATEMNGPLEQHVPWTHWGGDPAYPNKGNASKIMRFMKNDTQDSFLADPLVKGNKHLLSGGWGNKHGIEGEYGIEVFYNQVLTTKYLQHFPIVKMSDNEVLFENGVKSVREGENINYYRNDRLVAITPEASIGDTGIGDTLLFLPWNPVDEATSEKIYHWNPLGTTSEWTLPEGWDNLGTVQVYELSDLGRTFVKEVPVVDGKVTLEVEKDTPYLVTRGKVEEKRITDWGIGAQIEDPGFDSQSWNHWTLESEEGNVGFVNEKAYVREGNDLVEIGEKKAVLSQKIDKLVPGMTYSVSAWVKNDNNREVTLKVESGNEEATNVITKASKVRQGIGVKWYDDTFTRMEVEFTVPEGMKDAKVSLEAKAGETGSKVFVDDFRIWDNPGHTNRDGYVFYEDFENVDEGITPFFIAPGRGNTTRTHLAERDLDPNTKQKMNWVIDGRFSLKTNQESNEIGELLTTDESTFSLEPNKTYELGFVYTLEDATPGYSINIKSKSEGALASLSLDASLSGREVKTTFTTGDANDCYISIDKGEGYKELIVDNIYVKEVDDSIATPELEFVNFNTMVNKLEVGDVLDVYVNALMNNGADADLTNVEYVVSNPAVVSIVDGKMTALAEGKAKVSAKVTVDGKTVSSNVVTIKVGDFEEVPEEIKVSKVRSFKVKEKATTVDLTWKEPKDTVGLKEYILYKNGEELAVLSANNTEYMVDGLRPNTIYGFKIVAKYSNGEKSKPVSANVRTKKENSPKLSERIKSLFE